MGVNENDEDGILDSGSQPSAEANRYKQPKKNLEFRIDLKSAVNSIVYKGQEMPLSVI